MYRQRATAGWAALVLLLVLMVCGFVVSKEVAATAEKDKPLHPHILTHQHSGVETRRRNLQASSVVKTKKGLSAVADSGPAVIGGATTPQAAAIPVQKTPESLVKQQLVDNIPSHPEDAENSGDPDSIRTATGGFIYTLLICLTALAFAGNAAFMIYVFWLVK